ncbi:MAG: BrnT family toxin [Deltaproteobacteria bacterium]|nr:BrnT family toxin [Deltaproteobacteria bacterium]
MAFEWDHGNDTKNYSKHGVSCQEAESAFQDRRRLDFDDPFHSRAERRYITLGQSSRPRLLCVAWTLRGTHVRIISVRPASRKERHLYEEKNHQRTA